MQGVWRPGGAPIVLGVIVAVGILTGACAPPGGAPTAAATATGAPTQTAAAQDAAAKAVADLSGRLSVAPASIAVVAIEPHTWPDTSLGLPEPGQVYAQIVTSGYIVTLEYARQTFVYHVAGDTVRLDRERSAPVPSATPPF